MASDKPNDHWCEHGYFMPEPGEGECLRCDLVYMKRNNEELRAIIRALTRALTLAVGEERAAAELEKAHKEAKDA